MMYVLQDIARWLLLFAAPSIVAAGWTFGCWLGRLITEDFDANRMPH